MKTEPPTETTSDINPVVQSSAKKTAGNDQTGKTNTQATNSAAPSGKKSPQRLPIGKKDFQTVPDKMSKPNSDNSHLKTSAAPQLTVIDSQQIDCNFTLNTDEKVHLLKNCLTL